VARFSSKFWHLLHLMSDPNEPTEETNSGGVPPQPMAKKADPTTKARETVRIQVPAREPSRVPGALSFEPKKDMARIPLVPQPPSKPLPTIQMKKTQPLIAMPEIMPQSASIPAPLGEESAPDAIPMPLCWLLLGVAAIILLVQIWTYFS
jgi:hypothetical protein